MSRPGFSRPRLKLSQLGSFPLHGGLSGRIFGLLGSPSALGPLPSGLSVTVAGMTNLVMTANFTP